MTTRKDYEKELKLAERECNAGELVHIRGYVAQLEGQIAAMEHSKKTSKLYDRAMQAVYEADNAYMKGMDAKGDRLKAIADKLFDELGELEASFARVATK